MEFLSTANLFIIMIKSRRISFYLYEEYKFLFHYDNRLYFHRIYLSKIFIWILFNHPKWNISNSSPISRFYKWRWIKLKFEILIYKIYQLFSQLMMINLGTLWFSFEVDEACSSQTWSSWIIDTLAENYVILYPFHQFTIMSY